MAKGESLSDTVRTLECYGDVVVLRHPEVGAAALPAKHTRKPIINAGDGIGEHPTRALLDCFTIPEELDRLENLTVTMLGDLKYGRTVHSLARLLTQFSGIRLNCVSPDILRMPKDVRDEVAEKGIPQTESSTLGKAQPGTDVLYVTRVQMVRFEDPDVYEKVKSAYVLTPAAAAVSPASSGASLSSGTSVSPGRRCSGRFGEHGAAQHRAAQP